MAAKKPRSPDFFPPSTIFSANKGRAKLCQAVAVKEVLTWQIKKAMNDQRLSRKRLAERMGTSRSQISRLLDPKDGT